MYPDEPSRCGNPLDKNSSEKCRYVDLIYPADGEEITGILQQATWTSRPDVCNYQIQFAKDKKFQELYIDTQSSQAYYEFTDIDYGEYYWRIAIINCFNIQGYYTDYWSFTIIHPPLKYKRRAYQAEVINDSTMYVVGGIGYEVGNSSTTESYLSDMEYYNIDLNLNRWDNTSTSELDNGLSYAAMVNVKGKLFHMGGELSTGEAVNKMWSYDPSFVKWSIKEDMPVALSRMTASNVYDKIYVVGGKSATGAVNTVYKYDDSASKDKWSLESTCPILLYGHTTVVVGGKIYVIGGTDGNAHFNTMLIYDITSHTWETGKVMPSEGRSDLASVYYNGKIYVIGGYTYSGVTNAMTIYDIDSDTWTTGTPMLVGKSQIKAGLISSKDDKDTKYIFVPGGYAGEGFGITEKVQVFYINSNEWKP